ncbi:unnamed protein product, partial [Symbiodinium sp. KB8]
MPIPRWESLIPNLVQLQAPKVLLLMWTSNVDLRMQVEMLELFSGDAKVSQVFREAGLAMACVMREGPNAMNVLAPACGSWTQISRGTSMRMVLLLLLILAVHAVFLIEQPRGHYVDKNGVKRFTGLKNGLRESGSYSKAFGKKVFQLWEEECSSPQPRLCMRQKVPIAASMTDKEIFRTLPLGDTWPDAEMVELWAYLFQNKKLMVPAGWQAIMEEFNQELQDS